MGCKEKKGEKISFEVLARTGCFTQLYACFGTGVSYRNKFRLLPLYLGRVSTLTVGESHPQATTPVVLTPKRCMAVSVFRRVSF